MHIKYINFIKSLYQIKKIDYIFYSDKDSNIGTASLNKNWYKNIKKKERGSKLIN